RNIEIERKREKEREREDTRHKTQRQKDTKTHKDTNLDELIESAGEELAADPVVTVLRHEMLDDFVDRLFGLERESSMMVEKARLVELVSLQLVDFVLHVSVFLEVAVTFVVRIACTNSKKNKLKNLKGQIEWIFRFNK